MADTSDSAGPGTRDVSAEAPVRPGDIGAEFNAELERGRAVAEGVPLGQEPYVKPRDLRKLRKKKRS